MDEPTSAPRTCEVCGDPTRPDNKDGHLQRQGQARVRESP